MVGRFAQINATQSLISQLQYLQNRLSLFVLNIFEKSTTSIEVQPEGHNDGTNSLKYKYKAIQFGGVINSLTVQSSHPVSKQTPANV